jgi:uncharacterized protein
MVRKTRNELCSIKNKIVGRSKELELLQELLDSTRAEFVAVSGRRRVGKTFLITQFASSTQCLFFHVTGLQKGTLQEQLEQFAKQIAATFYPGATLAPRKRWIDALDDLQIALGMAPKGTKIILFFDEFPWMATPRSRLLTALELYWNRYWVNDDRIKLFICGSATSWIIEKIINNKGGLHNRITRSIDLKPFTLFETECYLKEHQMYLTQRQILDLYIVLGGIPYYWSFVRKGRSAHQVIDELCFQNDGILVNEFKRLFQSLFDDPKPYTELIRIIAQHRYGIGQAELITKSSLPDGGTTVRRLGQLEEAGFIMALTPFGHKERGIYYVMDDEYCLFYLHWIEPYLSTITKKIKNQGFWLSHAQGMAWKSWAGLAYESVCYKHIDQIRQALQIDSGSIAATWRSVAKSRQDEGAQIDLLFDRPDGAITLCEIKYSEKAFAIDKACAQKLVRKVQVFQKVTKTQKQVFLALVTTMGLKPTLYSKEIVTNEVVLSDLFQE